MNARIKRLVAIIIITAFILSFVWINAKIAFSDETKGKIDLFTQKIPFNGNGFNVSSDAFQPQELVILYALVTYNEYPVANKLVGFQAINPANMFQNITIVGTSFTNQSGIAEFSFRIPWPPENAEQIIFGEWFAIATVDVAGEVAVDTLTFQVCWIIKITNIATLNTLLEPQTKYSKGQIIVFNLTIENAALTPKLATIIIDVQDAANYPIIHVQKDDIFQPGEGHIYVTSQIPITAMIGEATVFAVAYTAPPELGGVPYSPAFSSKFRIIALRQYYLTVRTDPPDVVPISGEGWYDEGLNVTLTVLESVSIATGTRYEFSYWDIDGTSDSTNSITVTMNANHTATAHYILQYYLTVVSPYGSVGGEGWYNANTTAYATLNIDTIDHGNNTRRVFVNWSGDASGTGFMQSTGLLMDRPKTAVANWKIQYYLTVRVDPSGIVAIAGEGWYNEMENVALTALSVEGYDFGYWDVDGASKGDRVNAITIFMNNSHTATAHYNTKAKGWYVPWWSLFWFLLLPLLLILALIIALLYRRRKKKKTEETFYRGWTAWYYQYNLRNKTRKI